MCHYIHPEPSKWAALLDIVYEKQVPSLTVTDENQSGNIKWRSWKMRWISLHQWQKMKWQIRRQQIESRLRRTDNMSVYPMYSLSEFWFLVALSMSLKNLPQYGSKLNQIQWPGKSAQKCPTRMPITSTLGDNQCIIQRRELYRAFLYWHSMCSASATLPVLLR